MNLRKGIALTLLAVLFVTLAYDTGYAAGIEPGFKQLKNSVKDYHAKSDLNFVPVPTGEADLIMVWYVGLNDYGNGNVGIEGSTETYRPVEEVRVVVELQKKEGSSWTTIRTWSDVRFYSDQ
ncbi:MAG: hypothetical protein QME73_13600 [Bacillota bacterium]|nr:hypothetical protein [Bacillota bacterium]